jgi:hypothetical protein
MDMTVLLFSRRQAGLNELLPAWQEITIEVSEVKLLCKQIYPLLGL